MLLCVACGAPRKIIAARDGTAFNGGQSSSAGISAPSRFRCPAARRVARGESLPVAPSAREVLGQQKTNDLPDISARIELLRYLRILWFSTLFPAQAMQGEAFAQREFRSKLILGNGPHAPSTARLDPNASASA